MKIYAQQPFSGKDRFQFVESLRQAFRDMLQPEMEESLFAMDRDRDDQFFLKSSEAILWGRVYFEAFEKYHLELLKLEAECLTRTFRQPLRAYVFFNKTELDSNELLDYPCAEYFRYMMAHHGVDQAVMLEKVLGGAGSQDLVPSRKRDSVRVRRMGKMCSGVKAMPLTLGELSDLIDLSLELKV